MQQQQFSWQVDLSKLLSAFSESSHPILLASPNQGRYSIFSANPSHWITAQTPNKFSVAQQNQTQHFDQNLIQWLQSSFPISKQNEVVFNAGLMGYFSYDFGLQLQGINSQHEILPITAEMGYYPWSLVIDHKLGKMTLCANADVDIDTIINRLQGLQNTQLNNPLIHTSWTAQQNKPSYLDALNTIKQYILSGDCYQINYTQKWQAISTDSDVAIYNQLSKQCPTPFSGFLRAKNLSILSLSPERFISLSGNQLQTKPIKGTAPRFKDQAADKQSAINLKASLKDNAENVMIVDLLRNDLSKIAQKDSVTVTSLCAVESFPNVHHLVSTIEAQIKNDLHPLSIIEASFPGGSITGAPKRRAMEIVDELEHQGRGIYCGSLFYLSDSGHFDSNILIRTVIKQGNQLSANAGGGIVIDSEEEQEYQESFDKISAITRGQHR